MHLLEKFEKKKTLVCIVLIKGDRKEKKTLKKGVNFIIIIIKL